MSAAAVDDGRASAYFIYFFFLFCNNNNNNNKVMKINFLDHLIRLHIIIMGTHTHTHRLWKDERRWEQKMREDYREMVNKEGREGSTEYSSIMLP